MPLYQEAQEWVVWMADRTSHVHQALSLSVRETWGRVSDYGLR